MINFRPIAFSHFAEQDWFWKEPLIEALKNGNTDVTGFKFSPEPNIDFSKQGPFGFLTGVAISNYPDIHMTITGANDPNITAAVDQSGSFKVKLLGKPPENGPAVPTHSNRATSDKKTIP